MNDCEKTASFAERSLELDIMSPRTEKIVREAAKKAVEIIKSEGIQVSAPAEKNEGQDVTQVISNKARFL